MKSLLYEVIPVNDELQLAQLHEEDSARLFELTDYNRDYLGEFLPWVPYVTVPQDSKKHILETLEARASGDAYSYGILYKGIVIGTISLRNIKDTSLTEIGYWIDRPYSGKGLTTLAVEALTTFGFDVLGLPIIRIRAEPTNIGSNKVAEKAGYSFTETVDDPTYGTLNVWAINDTDHHRA